jgi:hypothetical protein
MLSARNLLAISMVMACCACTTLHSQSPPVVIVPPADLTADCAEPAGSVKTNQEVSVYLLDLRDALRSCNAQLGALRDWLKASK